MDKGSFTKDDINTLLERLRRLDKEYRKIMDIPQSEDLKEFGDNVKPKAAGYGLLVDMSELKEEKKEKDPNIPHDRYSVVGKDYWPAGKTTGKLPAGVYIGVVTNQGIFFAKQDLVVDDIIEIPGGQQDRVLQDIENFWNRVEYFYNHGYLHRRGILLYGSAGGGKSMTVRMIMNKIRERDGIIFLCNGSPSSVRASLTKFRQMEPERNVVCVFEDIDSIINDYGEKEVLALLDGESQIDRVLNLGTTNFPENLPKRIVNRPRRFDRVIKISPPDEMMRREYFSRKLKVDGKKLDSYVTNSKGFTFAAMAELVISVECLGNDFNETVKYLSQLNEYKPSSADDEGVKKVGFGG